MASVLDRIQADLVRAMKAGDKGTIETLRGLSSDLKYRRIEKGGDISEADCEAVLRRAAKKRRESIDLFRQGKREDLALKEEREFSLIQSYLPPDLSDDQIDDAVRQSAADVGAQGPSDVGRVMASVMKRLQGQAPGDRVRQRATDYLSSRS